MPNDIVKQWSNIGNGAFTSLKELWEINAELMKKLTQHQLEFTTPALRRVLST